MIFIAHRGNLDGVFPELENTPKYIDKCLNNAFDCEIDLRMLDGIPHLGHDTPDYPITADWIRERKEFLWIHAKEYGALLWLMDNVPDCKYFCHESDRYTLTSNRYIWSHDLTNPPTDKCIIPLLSKESIESYGHTGFYAVCSDFIYDCLDKFVD